MLLSSPRVRSARFNSSSQQPAALRPSALNKRVPTAVCAASLPRPSLSVFYSAASALLLCPPALADALSPGAEEQLLRVEELLGVQLLLIGGVAVAALRVLGAMQRPAEVTRFSDGRLQKTVVDITPRGSSGSQSGALMDQLFAGGVDPRDPVSRLMATSVISAKSSTPVKDVLPLLEQVSGVAIVADDDSKAVVGVFSKRDAAKVVRPSDAVSLWMTTPALVVAETTPVMETAALMLKFEVHRLPVVSASGQLVGLISRSDIFSALLSKYRSSDECSTDGALNT